MKIVIILLVAGLTGYVNADWYQDMENIGFFQLFVIQSLSISIPKNCSNISPDNLKIEQEKAIECVKNIRYNNSFCQTFVNHFKPCIQGIMEQITKCDEPKEIAMKNTVIDSIIEEARFVCGTDGEHILEILNPCVPKSVRNSYSCRRNITTPLKTALKNQKDLSVICGVFPSLQKCFEDELEQECENEITRSTLHDLISVDVKPCNIVMTLFFEIWQYL